MKGTKSKKEVASVAVRVYLSTHKKLKIRAAKEGRPIASIIREAIEIKVAV